MSGQRPSASLGRRVLPAAMLAGVSVVLITALDHPVHIGSAQPVDPAQPPGPGATDDPNAGDSRLPAEPCTG
ncbi:MAG TPA: hypothetical protein VGM78_03545, partial [Ilumatobacteraceae bacterium]